MVAGLAAVGVVVVAIPLCHKLVLRLLGFGSNGPVAGSVASNWQSSIGNAQSGSWFSSLQRRGMS